MFVPHPHAPLVSTIHFTALAKVTVYLERRVNIHRVGILKVKCRGGGGGRSSEEVVVVVWLAVMKRKIYSVVV